MPIGLLEYQFYQQYEYFVEFSLYPQNPKYPNALNRGLDEIYSILSFQIINQDMG